MLERMPGKPVIMIFALPSAFIFQLFHWVLPLGRQIILLPIFYWSYFGHYSIPLNFNKSGFGNAVWRFIFPHQ